VIEGTAVRGTCIHCGFACEWRTGDRGQLVPDYPCVASPSGRCEAAGQASKLAREISRRSERSASLQSRGFRGTRKSR